MKNIALKFFIKMLSKDDIIYDQFLKDLITKDKAKFIKNAIGYDNLWIQKYIKNEEFDKIENCIIIDSRFENCMINKVTNNLCNRTTFTGIYQINENRIQINNK